MKKEKLNNLVFQVIMIEAIAWKYSLKRCSQKFRKIHRKIPVSERLFFDKVAAPQPVVLIKTRLCVFCEFYEIFQNNNFVESLQKAASVKGLGS